ncbi:esterase-like activity of phytase family protein [Brevundimonas pondensis]|uniref:Esterase-like activity of phytase family protein n=1 Tax=Brevundimonas pondensis TaxID=2774189 RepID=A0ABX7SMM4_9CAUL|nr:esterase-like activity of phytase family protein [Brevundimonas pondensis]QTC88135.1 esterase-like activity of phytase family protein [Brevundimonas pondensis]
MNRRVYVAALAALTLAACASAVVTSQPWTPTSEADGWSPVSASTRTVGLGMPGAAVLGKGVRYAGGVTVLAGMDSPLHSLSDLKLTGDGGFISVSDVGDLARGRLALDARGRLIGLEGLSVRRLTLTDGAPISQKMEGDAEGLAITAGGDLLVSFERDHRIWNYGPLAALRAPEAVRRPDFPFTENDGMEGLAASGDGWRVAGESGGVWNCSAVRCAVVTPPPERPLTDADYRITGMDRDPAGGWFVVQRSYRAPIDVRARVRRMAQDGTLGPVLVELKLPGTTDNFEGIAAERRGDRTRLYILSDDNFNAVQRTMMLAFDIR